MQKLLSSLYYDLRPLIPRRLQILLRRMRIQVLSKTAHSRWPIDESADGRPRNWSGWPDGKKFVLVIMHDVETHKGMQRCSRVMNRETELGFKSCFNIVPERYFTSMKQISEIWERGFEVGVQGLKHDGKLYRSKNIFMQRSNRINNYIDIWKASGFRSPAMHHRLEWLSALNIRYDSSTFDTDPFEPQPDGVKHIYPYMIRNGKRSFVEMPYTLAQDFTLFVLMKKNNTNAWRRKLDWLAEKGGMALVTVHPDYMNFGDTPQQFDEYPASLFFEFLEYIRDNYPDQYWNPLPKDLAEFWWEQYENDQYELVKSERAPFR